MFIELPNESRINIEHITKYYLHRNVTTLYIYLGVDSYEDITFPTKQEAEYFLQALDRAVGIKQLMIRK